MLIVRQEAINPLLQVDDFVQVFGPNSFKIKKITAVIDCLKVSKALSFKLS
jgi:hypothetical protein